MNAGLGVGMATDSEIVCKHMVVVVLSTNRLCIICVLEFVYWKNWCRYWLSTLLIYQTRKGKKGVDWQFNWYCKAPWQDVVIIPYVLVLNVGSWYDATCHCLTLEVFVFF